MVRTNAIPTINRVFMQVLPERRRKSWLRRSRAGEAKPTARIRRAERPGARGASLRGTSSGIDLVCLAVSTASSTMIIEGPPWTALRRGRRRTTPRPETRTLLRLSNHPPPIIYGGFFIFQRSVGPKFAGCNPSAFEARRELKASIQHIALLTTDLGRSQHFLP